MKGSSSGLQKHRVLIFSMAVACLGPGFAVAADPTIISDYGALYGVDGRFRRTSLHGGIDYAVAGGDPVLAAAPGEVTRVFDSSSVVPPGVFPTLIQDWCGIGAVVRHTDFRTVYCHLSSRAVQLGDQVARGQLIGGAGLTGMSGNVVHLHFAVFREGSGYTNPHPFLTAGCFDPGKAYPDPNALTYPVKC